MTCSHCPNHNKIQIPWVTIYFAVVMTILMAVLVLQFHIDKTHPKLFLLGIALSIAAIFLGKVIDLI